VGEEIAEDRMPTASLRLKREGLVSASSSVAALATTRPDSVSRFKRSNSERISEACW